MKQIEQYLINQRLDRFFFLAFISVAVLIHFGCMNPHEYEPEEPLEKPEPPEAPIIIRPEPDQEFPSKEGRNIPLEWSPVEGKDYYEFEIDTTPGFTHSYPHEVRSSSTSFYLLCYPPTTTYYFRARAYSGDWVWYTDWSETRRFYLISVSADTVFW